LMMAIEENEKLDRLNQQKLKDLMAMEESMTKNFQKVPGSAKEIRFLYDNIQKLSARTNEKLASQKEVNGIIRKYENILKDV